MHLGHHHHHHQDGASNGGAGHNHAQPPRKPVQWQTPHLPHGHESEQASPVDADVDLVEAAFVEGFLAASDPTSFLRLVHVPFEAVAADGARLVLLRVEIEAVADLGAVTPQLGGEGFRYDPLPAKLVSRRKRLRFCYVDGSAVRALPLGAVRGLDKSLP
jgi:hypothetical protein